MKVFTPTLEENIEAAKKIKAYLRKYPQVQQQKLPLLYICGGKDCFNSETGERVTSLTATTNSHTNINKRLTLLYTNYDPQLNVCEITYVTKNTKCWKANENNIRPWYIINQDQRYFLVDGHKSWYNIVGNHVEEDCVRWTNYYGTYAYTKCGSAKAMLNFAASHVGLYANDLRRQETNRLGVHDLLQYIIDNNLQGTATLAYDAKNPYRIYWQLGEWSQLAETTKVRKMSSKREQDVTKILESFNDLHELPAESINMPIVVSACKYNNSPDFSYLTNAISYAFYEHITCDLGIFRVFRCDNSKICKYINENMRGLTTQKTTDIRLSWAINQYKVTINLKDIWQYAKEVNRVVVTDGKVYCFELSSNTWKIMSRVNPIAGLADGNEIKVLNQGETAKNNAFRYIYNLFENDGDYIMSLYTALRNPIIESFMKIGLTHIAKTLLSGNCVNANALLFFGKPKSNQHKHYQNYGLNLYQLRELESVLQRYYSGQHSRHYYYAGQQKQLGVLFKQLLNGSDEDAQNKFMDASNYSNEQTDKAIEMLMANLDTNLSLIAASRWSRTSYAMQSYLITDRVYTDQEKSGLFARLYNIAKKDETPQSSFGNNFRLIYETINLYNQLRYQNLRPTIDIYSFRKVDEFRHTHDRLIEFQIQCRNYRGLNLEQLEHVYEKDRKSRLVFEEENEKYKILLPEHVKDLDREGRYLHHCVGGYMRNHATGETTILFLRDKQDLATPWYTIEVRNKSLIQIHGSHNCWLSSTEEGYAAVPFVYQWLKKHEIDFNERILLSMANGYSAMGATLREKPDELK